MAANTIPRYTLSGDYSNNGGTAFGGTILTATGDFTGVSANHVLVFTAGTNGGRIIGVHLEAIGTNTQSVARIYINNGSSNATATNNVLIGQLTLPATTTSNIAAVGSGDYYFPNGAGDLNPGFKVYVGLGTTVAAGWIATPIQGGQF